MFFLFFRIEMEELNTGRRPQKAKEKIPEIVIDREYFVRVSKYKFLAVFLGLSLYAFLCFHPSPESYLNKMGGPGQRFQYLRENYMVQMRIGMFFAILLHIGESLYAVKLGTQLGLSQEAIQKWAIQTGIMGYSGLQDLIKYHGEKYSKVKSS